MEQACCNERRFPAGADEVEPEGEASGLDAAAWRTVIAAHPVRFRVVSSSMEPALRPGDSVVVEPVGDPLVPGEVIMYLEGSRLIIHRYLGGTRCRGDARLRTDPPFERDRIIGVVRRFFREGQEKALPRRHPVKIGLRHAVMQLHVRGKTCLKACLPVRVVHVLKTVRTHMRLTRRT